MPWTQTSSGNNLELKLNIVCLFNWTRVYDSALIVVWSGGGFLLLNQMTFSSSVLALLRLLLLEPCTFTNFSSAVHYFLFWFISTGFGDYYKCGKISCVLWSISFGLWIKLNEEKSIYSKKNPQIFIFKCNLLSC